MAASEGIYKFAGEQLTLVHPAAALPFERAVALHAGSAEATCGSPLPPACSWRVQAARRWHRWQRLPGRAGRALAPWSRCTRPPRAGSGRRRKMACCLSRAKLAAKGRARARGRRQVLRPRARLSRRSARAADRGSAGQRLDRRAARADPLSIRANGFVTFTRARRPARGRRHRGVRGPGRQPVGGDPRRRHGPVHRPDAGRAGRAALAARSLDQHRGRGRAGALWVGTRSGLTRWHAGASAPTPAPMACLPTTCCRFIPVGPGEVWVGTEAGLARWRDGRLDVPAVAGRRRSPRCTSIRTGVLWIGSVDGSGAAGGRADRAFAGRAGPRAQRDPRHAARRSRHAVAIGRRQAAAGGAGAGGAGARRLPPIGRVRAFHRDRDGTLWLGTGDGLFRNRAGGHGATFPAAARPGPRGPVPAGLGR